jgi:hypothetical protein
MGRGLQTIPKSIFGTQHSRFYIKDDKKIVTDVAVIDRIEDSIKATKELLKSKGDTIVYHTGADKIIIEMRKLTGLRGYSFIG